MSVVADFSVPSEAFCLDRSLRAVPDATVEFDRLVAHSPDYVMPFIWVVAGDREVFADAVGADPTVEAATVTDSFDDADLYQVDWAPVVSERLRAVLDNDGVILEARGTESAWSLSVRFGSRDHFSDFQGHFRAFGEMTLHRLGPPQTPGDVTYGVSAAQREALLAAHDAGYYDTPSGTSGEELADELGVSQQAVSRRLRRGVDTLVANTLGRHRED